MKRRSFLGAAGATLATPQVPTAQQAAPRQVHPGVWRFTFGTPEKITPVSTRHYAPEADALTTLPAVAACPVRVTGSVSRRGTLVHIPLAPNEIVYGLGLQLQSFVQRGLKKKLRVNADPKIDSGDSHAPVPFYVTTAGYGVLVDTARYATFYCGGKLKKQAAAAENGASPTAEALPAAYRRYRANEASEAMIEIPEADGVDVYVFAGPTMRAAVQRYNLFSGGGALPPRWGLGMWYRVKGDFNQEQTLRLASEFRERRIPCDVIGLEPGWQTHAYSCTYVWSKNFPDPAGLASLAGPMGPVQGSVESDPANIPATAEAETSAHPANTREARCLRMTVCSHASRNIKRDASKIAEKAATRYTSFFKKWTKPFCRGTSLESGVKPIGHLPGNALA